METRERKVYSTVPCTIMLTEGRVKSPHHILIFQEQTVQFAVTDTEKHVLTHTNGLTQTLFVKNLALLYPDHLMA